MSTKARTPDGHKKVAEGVQNSVAIDDNASPYDLPVDTYLTADSTNGPITVNLPSAKNGDILTIAHPAGVANDVTLQAAANEQIDEGPGPLAINTNGATSFRAVNSAGTFGWNQI